MKVSRWYQASFMLLTWLSLYRSTSVLKKVRQSDHNSDSIRLSSEPLLVLASWQEGVDLTRWLARQGRLWIRTASLGSSPTHAIIKSIIVDLIALMMTGLTGYLVLISVRVSLPRVTNSCFLSSLTLTAAASYPTDDDTTRSDWSVSLLWPTNVSHPVVV